MFLKNYFPFENIKRWLIENSLRLNPQSQSPLNHSIIRMFYSYWNVTGLPIQTFARGDWYLSNGSFAIPTWHTYMYCEHSFFKVTVNTNIICKVLYTENGNTCFNHLILSQQGFKHQVLLAEQNSSHNITADSHSLKIFELLNYVSMTNPYIWIWCQVIKNYWTDTNNTSTAAAVAQWVRAFACKRKVGCFNPSPVVKTGSVSTTAKSSAIAVSFTSPRRWPL